MEFNFKKLEKFRNTSLKGKKNYFRLKTNHHFGISTKKPLFKRVVLLYFKEKI